MPQVRAMGSIPKNVKKNISPECLSPIEITKGKFLGYIFLWWPLVGHGNPDHFSPVVWWWSLEVEHGSSMPKKVKNLFFL